MFNLNEIIIIVIFLCLEFLKISQNIRVNFISFGFCFFTATVRIRRSKFLWLTRVFDFAIRGNYLYKHLAQKREKKLFSFVYHVQKRALKENKYPASPFHGKIEFKVHTYLILLRN